MSELPKGWRETTLDSIGKWSSGGTPKRTVSEYYNGDIPWLVIGDLNDGYVTSARNSITKIGLERSNAKLIEPNSLLIAMYGSIGKLGINKIRCATNQAIAACSIDESVVNLKFLFYFLMSQRKQLLLRGKGGAQQNISQAVLKAYKISLPILEEQKRIADKLDSVLAKVEAAQARLDKIPAILKRFRQSVLAAATSGELTQDWRDKNFTNEWETKSLIDLVDEKPRNGRSPKGVNYETSFRNLTLSATTQGKFVEGCYKFVEMDIDKDSHLWVKNGDILIQRANSLEYVGVSALYDGEDNQYVYPDLMMKCRANDKVKSKYLHYCLLSEEVRKYFRNNATGTAGNMPKINQATVSGAPINVPSLKEQVEIISRVEILFEHANKLDKHYNAAKVRLDKLTQSILAKAFRGELLAVSGADLAPVDSRSSVEILI